MVIHRLASWIQQKIMIYLCRGWPWLHICRHTVCPTLNSPVSGCSWFVWTSCFSLRTITGELCCWCGCGCGYWFIVSRFARRNAFNFLFPMNAETFMAGNATANGIHSWDNLILSLRVSSGNGLKHFPQTCGVLYSSTKTTLQSRRFSNDVASFRVPGHRLYFWIGECLCEIDVSHWCFASN